MRQPRRAHHSAGSRSRPLSTTFKGWPFAYGKVDLASLRPQRSYKLVEKQGRAMSTVEDSAKSLEQWISEMKDVDPKPIESTAPIEKEQASDSKKDVRRGEIAQLNANIRSIQAVLDQHRDIA
jgi:hypothetical protein